MTDAGYVVGGWTVTGVVFAGYVARLWLRTRRVRKLVPPEVEDGQWR
jgi:hypothetical protein